MRSKKPVELQILGLRRLEFSVFTGFYYCRINLMPLERRFAAFTSHTLHFKCIDSRLLVMSQCLLIFVLLISYPISISHTQPLNHTTKLDGFQWLGISGCKIKQKRFCIQSEKNVVCALGYELTSGWWMRQILPALKKIKILMSRMRSVSRYCWCDALISTWTFGVERFCK